MNDIDSPRDCDEPIFWLSEEPDGFTFGARATPDRVWVAHEAPGEQRQYITADACGRDRRPLPDGYRISLFRLWNNLACDTVQSDIYRVDDALLPIGDPIARNVNCGFHSADEFGLTFRLDTREIVRVTDDAVEPLGLYLPRTPENWTVSWGGGLMDGNADSVFVVAGGGLYEVRIDSVSAIVAEGVAWAEAGYASRAERPRWLLLWEVSPYVTRGEDDVAPRLLDLASGEQREVPTTEWIRLEPPWLSTQSFATHLDRDQEYAMPEDWEVSDTIDSERLLLRNDQTESTSVWTPETGSLIELGTLEFPYAGADGAYVTEDGRHWVYPYDGSPRYLLVPSQPALSSWWGFGDWTVGTTESNELVLYDVASTRSNVLDEGVTELHPNLFAHPDAPRTVFYEKPDGDLAGLWSLQLE